MSPGRFVGDRTFEQRRNLVRLAALPLRIALAFILLSGTWPGLADAQVISPVPGGANAPGLGMATNGTPIVNINTPNAAGLSNNSYTSFNVGSSNLVLSNANKIVTTQTGGTISANPNLAASGPASVILNQVTSANPSMLAGYVEVGGANAQVIIANPYGITCSGCGFINSSHVTLTTGTPAFDSSGGVASYQITQGTIVIEGLGLDASRVTTLDIFSRAIAVNAGIWANKVNASYGAGIADTNGNVAGEAVANEAAPAFGLDVAALGGMYANKIVLVGTPEGLGFNTAGTVSGSGDVTVLASGQVIVSGQIYAGTDLSLNTAGNVDVSGVLYGARSNSIVSGGAFTGSGIVASGGNVGLTAATASISGILAAGLAANGTLAGNSGLAVSTSGNSTLTGQALASGAVSWNASDIANTGEVQGSADSLVAGGPDGITNSGQILAIAGSLSVGTPASLKNSGSLQSASDIIMSVGNLSNVGTVSAGGNLTAVAGVLDNTGSIYAAGTQKIGVSGALTNDHGASLRAGGDAAIIAGSVGNSGTIYAGGNLTQTVSGAIASGGQITALGNVNLSGASLDNSGIIAAGIDTSGDITGTGNLTSNTSGATASAGELVSGNATAITGSRLGLSGSVQGATVTLGTTNGDLVTTGTVSAIGGPLVAIATGNLVNSGILGGSTLALTANGGSITTATGGAISAGTSAILRATSEVKLGGTVRSGTDTNIAASDIAISGSVYAGGNSTITAMGSGPNGGVVTNTGQIGALGDLNLAGQSLNSSGSLAAGLDANGSIIGGGNLTSTTNGLTVISGAAFAGGSISILY